MSSPLAGQEEEEEGGMPKAAAQSNAPLAVHPGSARVSGPGAGGPLEREGREAASHLLLLLRPRFGSSLPFSWDKNVTPFNWIRPSFRTNVRKIYLEESF